MTNELAPITNEEIMSLTGEDQQMGGSGLIKYVKLLQKYAIDITTNYKSLIEMHPENKAKLQAEMLAELDKQIPLGSYVIKDGKDEMGDILKSLGKPFIGQILKTRYSWATKMNVVPALHTSETDKQGGSVDIFNDANEKIDSMPGTLLKEKYPTLKMQNQLYIYESTSQSLYKIAVRGGSFTNWFAYCNTFPKTVSKATFETIFDSEKLSSKDTATGAVNEYYAMTFARGSAITDNKTTAQMLRELNALLGINPITILKEQTDTPTISESISALMTPSEKPSVTVQSTIPNLKDRKKMIEEASAAATARSEKESSDMPDDFLVSDKE